MNALIRLYVKEKMELYNLVLDKRSPFNLTPQQFAKEYPDYTKKLCQFTDHIPEFSREVFFPSFRQKMAGFSLWTSTDAARKQATIKELYLQLCIALYIRHPFSPKKAANTL